MNDKKSIVVTTYGHGKIIDGTMQTKRQSGKKGENSVCYSLF
jgi:hypothetical protein